MVLVAKIIVVEVELITKAIRMILREKALGVRLIISWMQ